jgi:hypothetical protein
MPTNRLRKCDASGYRSRRLQPVLLLFLMGFVGIAVIGCTHLLLKHRGILSQMHLKLPFDDAILLSAASKRRLSDFTATKVNYPGESLIRNSTSRKFFGFLINADGNFLHRVHQFNRALAFIRQRILAQQQTTADINKSNNYDRNDAVVRIGKQPEILLGARDDYLELLATRHRHIVTVALPWLVSSNQQTTGELIDMPDYRNTHWNSLTDFSNVLVQKYYDWTGDNELCAQIETPGASKQRYDVTLNRMCKRNRNAAAIQPQSLRPLLINSKPLEENQYWPNNSELYPPHFYTDTPSYVFHLHVHSDAVVNELGDVFSGLSVLLLHTCRDSSTKPLSTDAASRPLYDEVLTVTQHWGTSVFHQMVEVMPRIAVYVEFLQAHPKIKIHAPGSEANRMNQLVRLFGIDDRRLIYGTVRAKVVYQPRSTGCGFANVQESQLTSKFFRDFIARTFSSRRICDRLLLIRRSSSRKFTEQWTIERLLKQTAADFGLTYELFPDSPTPSLNDTMMMFNAAVIIVAPHGAGLSNILFSEPDTSVVEGVCNSPHVNLCYQRLAHVLGHRWHGLMSRGGCEAVVDVSASALDQVVREQLRIWNYTVFHSPQLERRRKLNSLRES